MSHRIQIMLEDAQYERLLAESRSSGLSIAELVRRAVDRMYGRTSLDEFAKALEESFGAWERDFSPIADHNETDEFSASVKSTCSAALASPTNGPQRSVSVADMSRICVRWPRLDHVGMRAEADAFFDDDGDRIG
ncbi:MAG: hypothetical protein LBM23_09760 [Propionibacteriaceae bacterium]|jgi:hypothetical protein|nr:hypothetical protein [Propionibacteriaceae bacterium]